MLNSYGLYAVVLQNVTDILKVVIFQTLYIGKTVVVPFIREHVGS